MLTIDVHPGRCLGAFRIGINTTFTTHFQKGMPIAETISHLQQKQIRTEILYSTQDPLNTDIILNLVMDGIMFRFEPISQRLKMIEVYDFRKVRLTYSATLFSGPSTEPTFVKIYKLFGPTYPGKYDQKSGCYVLSYPGLTMFFPIPEKFKKDYENSQEIPIEFSDGTTPIVTRLFLYRGHNYEKPELPLLSAFHERGNFYFEEVTVQLGHSVTFGARQKTIYFDTSPQDIISEIGAPEKIFYKKQDKLRIHATKSETGHGGGRFQPSAIDYFYNYFSMGMDVMFDGESHTVKKIILHTNFPGSKDFNVYAKCNFKIQVPGDSFQPKYITPQMKFSDVQKLLGTENCSKPLVNANIPFGGTKFYAYKNCIFEVLKNGYFNSVTLFVDD